MQRGGDEAERGQRVHRPIFGAMHCRRRNADAVAIDQRGDESAVHDPRKSDLVRLWREGANRVVAVPVTFDMQALFIQSPAAVAMRDVIGIKVLEGFLRHMLPEIYHKGTKTRRKIVILNDTCTALRACSAGE